MGTDKSPAFPFYPRDFVSDLDVAAMTLEQVGFYVRLLCYSWLKDGLPNDFNKLARALSLSEIDFARLWEIVGEKFALTDDGMYRNERQEEERAKQLAHRAERSEAGKAGNAKKYGPKRRRLLSDRSATAQGSLSDRSALAKSRSAIAIATAVCVPTTGAENAIDGVAEVAWSQWCAAYQRAGYRAVSLGMTAREASHCIKWAMRYPDAEWRDRQLAQFFLSKETKRGGQPNIGWFVETWMDEIDKALRDAGYKPKSEAA